MCWARFPDSQIPRRTNPTTPANPSYCVEANNKQEEEDLEMLATPCLCLLLVLLATQALSGDARTSTRATTATHPHAQPLAASLDQFWQLATAHLPKKNSPRKKNLRTENIDLEQLVKKDGWFETVYYDKSNCKHPNYKDVTALNTCGWSEDYDAYITKTAVANTDSHHYTVYDNVYTQNGCDTLSYSTGESEPILICTNYMLNHVIPQPLNPMTDNLNGFAAGVYDTATNCQARTTTGLLEAAYQRLNFCWYAPDGDYKFTACSGGVLTYNKYETTDVSCSGPFTAYQVAQAEMCQAADSTLDTFQGFPNWVCEN